MMYYENEDMNKREFLKQKYNISYSENIEDMNQIEDNANITDWTNFETFKFSILDYSRKNYYGDRFRYIVTLVDYFEYLYDYYKDEEFVLEIKEEQKLNKYILDVLPIDNPLGL